MPSIRDFVLTKHARERVKDRFPELHAEWEKQGKPALVIKAAYEFMWEATEDKSLTNDTAMRVFFDEKYPGKPQYYFVRDNIVFVGTHNSDTGDYIIVTVIPRPNSGRRAALGINKKPTGKRYVKA